MRKFQLYGNKDFTFENQEYKKRFYDDPYSPHTEGYGYGFYFGGTYCNDNGSGAGNGLKAGDGYGHYPIELIQYWNL